MRRTFSRFQASKYYKPIKVAFVLGVFVVMPAYWIISAKHHFNYYSKYTIGHTTRKYFVPSMGWWNVDYIFTYNNKEYSRGLRYKDRIIVPGGRYYVRFSYKKPGISEMLYDYPVPDSIISAPLVGWDSIPGIGRPE